MKDLKKRIEEIQTKLRKYRRTGIKEYPTRMIFIDPLLDALGWDVRDPDEVELEYPTIDSKAVDYALKLNGQPVILLEAKALDDQLNDVKALTQVVGYAANDGIDWCILTNGIRYRIYRSSEKVPAPQKLLYEVSIDPDDVRGQSIEQVLALLGRFSKAAMSKGVLDEIGDELFTTAKVRRALDQLFTAPDDSLVRLVRKAMNDDGVAPAQVKSALSRIWTGGPASSVTKSHPLVDKAPTKIKPVAVGKPEYDEKRHIDGRPIEVVELYRELDRFCLDRAQGQVVRRFLAQNVAWCLGKSTFCSVHLLQSGLKMWLRLNPSDIPASITNARDVSKVGHWGIGDVEFSIDSLERLRQAEPFIQASFVKSVESQK